MGCEAVFKGTKVDGVYDKDPKKFADAKRYDHVSYDEALETFGPGPDGVEPLLKPALPELAPIHFHPSRPHA
jgi:uridylate kinase